jgi:hypothetical protein
MRWPVMDSVDWLNTLFGINGDLTGVVYLSCGAIYALLLSLKVRAKPRRKRKKERGSVFSLSFPLFLSLLFCKGEGEREREMESRQRKREEDKRAHHETEIEREECHTAPSFVHHHPPHRLSSRLSSPFALHTRRPMDL